MPKVAMDSKCHQAIGEDGSEATHYPRADDAGKWQGKRLTGLRQDLESSGDTLDIVDLQNEGWADSSVLIIAGRHDCVSFTGAELERIAGFSQSGGGVLLMANHPTQFVKPQNQVCERLRLPVVFDMIQGSRARCQVLPHQISENCDSIWVRTCCRMSVSLEPLVAPLASHSEESIGHIAAAIDADGHHGRVVVTASAGHIASLDDSEADLYATMSNGMWTLNIVSWLQRIS